MEFIMNPYERQKNDEKNEKYRISSPLPLFCIVFIEIGHKSSFAILQLDISPWRIEAVIIIETQIVYYLIFLKS